METQILGTVVGIAVFTLLGGILKEALFPTPPSSEQFGAPKITQASKPIPTSKPIPAFKPIPAPEPTLASELIQAQEPIPASEPTPAPGSTPNSEPSPHFEPTPASEQIQESESVSDSENVPVATVASAEEMESAPSWKFERRSLPTDDQNLRAVLDSLSSSLIYILTSLLMEYLIRHIYRRCWRRKSGSEQMFSYLRMLLHKSTGLMSECKIELNLVKVEEDHRFAQFLKEVQSMKRIMKVRDKHFAEFQNEMNSVKMLIKFQGQKRAEFQNAMDSTKNMMKRENKCNVKFRDEIESMKMAMERKSLIPVKRTAHHSASKQTGVRIWEPRKPCDIASMSTAQEMNVPINKVRVRLLSSQVSWE
jgi:hypothetical protein